ncbi:12587_t:CDS:2 [Ambispora leptoticha]|uniref:12587_t:CDS:1 n=1 Tax=Ambispora leptoticha TaxID=144679 RepID=A0A9N9BCB0_9GLOM|nr:12587_t:CDS:2 [Ambispora leptoticha]
MSLDVIYDCSEKYPRISFRPRPDINKHNPVIIDNENDRYLVIPSRINRNNAKIANSKTQEDKLSSSSHLRYHSSSSRENNGNEKKEFATLIFPYSPKINSNSNKKLDNLPFSLREFSQISNNKYSTNYYQNLSKFFNNSFSFNKDNAKKDDSIAKNDQVQKNKLNISYAMNQSSFSLSSQLSTIPPPPPISSKNLTLAPFYPQITTFPPPSQSTTIGLSRPRRLTLVSSPPLLQSSRSITIPPSLQHSISLPQLKSQSTSRNTSISTTASQHTITQTSNNHSVIPLNDSHFHQKKPVKKKSLLNLFKKSQGSKENDPNRQKLQPPPVLKVQALDNLQSSPNFIPHYSWKLVTKLSLWHIRENNIYDSIKQSIK